MIIKKNKILLLTISIFFILSLIIILLQISFSRSSNNINIPNNNADNIIIENTIIPTDIKTDNNYSLTFSAWIPDWGSKSGLESLENEYLKFNSISPVWYEVNSDGSLKKKYPSNRNLIIKYLKDNDIEIIPAIALFDHNRFSEVLQNESSLVNHIEDIYNTVLENNYDGIDLDYESIKYSDRLKYFEFINKLSGKLHSSNKKLIITVVAKWGDLIIYPSLKETRLVQDWSYLSLFADEIRIMAYDYTFIKSDNPGPIGPLNWLDEILKYAVKKIPKEKIILGVHLYSYEWKANQELQFLTTFGESNNNYTANSYTYGQVKNIIKNNNGELIDYEGEKIFKYIDSNNMHRTLVYIDNNGINDRINLSKNYGIKGLVFWRLGGEDNLLNLYTLN